MAPILAENSLGEGDVICLSSHDSQHKLLSADALSASPRLAHSGGSSAFLPTEDVDSHSFIIRRAIRTATHSGPIQPRELVTLQHVASGQYLSENSVVSLQPHAGSGAAWEIGRVLPSLGAAALQIGELVFVRGESSLQYLSSSSDGGEAVRCSERPERWRLLRYAERAAPHLTGVMNGLRFGDLVTLSLPGDAAGCLAARVEIEEGDVSLVDGVVSGTEHAARLKGAVMCVCPAGTEGALPPSPSSNSTIRASEAVDPRAPPPPPATQRLPCCTRARRGRSSICHPTSLISAPAPPLTAAAAPPAAPPTAALVVPSEEQATCLRLLFSPARHACSCVTYSPAR